MKYRLEGLSSRELFFYQRVDKLQRENTSCAACSRVNKKNEKDTFRVFPTNGGTRTIISCACTDSRPRARYQLRGLPLVGSECVCPQCDSSFVVTRGSAKPSAFGLPVHLKSSLETQTEKVEHPSQQNLCQMPNGMTTAVQHPPKAHLRLPTTSWSRPISFDKPSCPYVRQ